MLNDSRGTVSSSDTISGGHWSSPDKTWPLLLQLLYGSDTKQSHGSLNLDLEDVHDSNDALATSGTQTVEVRFTNTHTISSQSQSLNFM